MTMDAVFNWGDPIIGVARTYLTSKHPQRRHLVEHAELLQSEGGPAAGTKAAVETDVEKRKALYKEFQEIVVKLMSRRSCTSTSFRQHSV